MKIKQFTKEQEQFILDNYLLIPTKRISTQLDVGIGRILRYLNRNNLVIPEEVKDRFRAMGYFKTGEAAFNKGLKITEYMSKESVSNVTKTQFKKGHEPHNTKHDKAVVERFDTSAAKFYKWIRLKKGVWKEYHRYVWEQKNGSIPKGYVITFIDGNSLNTNIENLKLISRTELMYNNSNQNYPKEIIPSLVLIKQLEKKWQEIN